MSGAGIAGLLLGGGIRVLRNTSPWRRHQPGIRARLN
jgi:uncharacterized protein involved in exopolysaccharide biosynthesis